MVVVECVVSWADQHHGVITALATIVIAAFTGTLFWATWGLWAESKRSISLAKRAMRVSSKAYVFGDVNKDSIRVEADKISFRVHAINYGNSPAMVEKIGLIFGATVPGGKARYPNAETVTEKFPLGPSKDLHKPAHEFQTHRGAPYVMGYIEFRDIFGESNTSRFCRRILPDTKSTEIAGGAAWNRFDYESEE